MQPLRTSLFPPPSLRLPAGEEVEWEAPSPGQAQLAVQEVASCPHSGLCWGQIPATAPGAFFTQLQDDRWVLESDPHWLRQVHRLVPPPQPSLP